MFSSLEQESVYNCTLRIVRSATGVYQGEGSTITLEEKASKIKAMDNCHAQFNYELNKPLMRKTYGWHVDQDKYSLVLTLCTANGKQRAHRHIAQ